MIKLFFLKTFWAWTFDYFNLLNEGMHISDTQKISIHE